MYLPLLKCYFSTWPLVTLWCPFISPCEKPLSISYRARSSGHWLVQLMFVWNVLIFLSLLKGNFARYRIPGWHFFSFSTLNTLSHWLLASKVSNAKSGHSLIEDPLYMTICFSVVAFKILSSSFESLIISVSMWDSLSSSYLESLNFLGIYIHVFWQIWEVFSHYFFI